MFNRGILRIVKRHFQNNFIIYFILISLFIAGNIVGPLLLNGLNRNTKYFFLRLTNPYIKSMYLINFTNTIVFKNSLINNFLLVLSLGILSLFSIGMIITPVIILIKGMSIGLMVGYLVDSHGFKGFIISILGIFPQNLFIILGVIGLGAVTMSISNNSKKRTGWIALGVSSPATDDYLPLILVYVFIVFLSSLIEGYFSSNILRLILRSYI